VGFWLSTMANFLKDGGTMTLYLDGGALTRPVLSDIWLSAMVCLPSAINNSNTETNRFVQYKSF